MMSSSRPMVPRDGPDPPGELIAPDDLSGIKKAVQGETTRGDSEGVGSSTSDDLRKSHSPGNKLPNGDISHGEDEIAPSGPPANRDIRFGDLPHPRKESEGPGDDAVSDTEDGLGRRTVMIENPHHQGHTSRDSGPSMPRRTGSIALTGAAAIERVLSNAFGRTRRDESPNSRMIRRSSMTLPYFTFTPTVGRNSLFVDLTEDQREELGGVEYRAVKTLLWVLLCIYFL